jgi:hypothetical protein
LGFNVPLGSLKVPFRLKSLRTTLPSTHFFEKHFFTARCPLRHRCPWSDAFLAKLSGDPAALPPKYFLNRHTKSNHMDASILNRVRIGWTSGGIFAFPIEGPWRPVQSNKIK